MTFLLSEEQLEFREMATRFAREKIAPDYQKREVEARIDRALIRELGQLGLIAPELPEEFGGLGAPSVTTGVITEAIGYADVNVAYLQILSSLNGKIFSRPMRRRIWRMNGFPVSSRAKSFCASH